MVESGGARGQDGGDGVVESGGARGQGGDSSGRALEAPRVSQSGEGALEGRPILSGEGALEGRPISSGEGALEGRPVSSGEGSLECELVCSAEVFIAIAEGHLHPSAAVLARLAEASSLPALLRIRDVCAWERERFWLYMAQGHLGTCSPARAAAGDACLGGGASSEAEAVAGAEGAAHDEGLGEGLGGGAGSERLAKYGIDEDLVRLAKQQMRRRAEEAPDGAPSGTLGHLIGSYIGGDAAAIWASLRSLRAGNLRGLRQGGVWSSPRAASSSSSAAAAPQRELTPGPELLAYLGGDAELAQGFAFIHHAFLGCDWRGSVHVTVHHERGIHTLTLGVSPEAARLFEGLSSEVPGCRWNPQDGPYVTLVPYVCPM